ncbi:hypothetical protein [Maribellus maritimus]|uniref:hypothetical protein n=1 Tax=Maribellus maritimus TaxID=2870838 RepID=UPI001EEB4D07|nr:hypothetical protein [Maribellus maritimus]MCG6191564.1 hypothetical protein [Maribellus maritimus]
MSHSFLPDSTTEIIRTYSRHRQNLIRQTGQTVLKVQKYLRLMNMRLDVVVNDIVGLTGTKIINAFIKGETKGIELAKYRHYNCRNPEKEIGHYNIMEEKIICLPSNRNGKPICIYKNKSVKLMSK